MKRFSCGQAPGQVEGGIPDNIPSTGNSGSLLPSAAQEKAFCEGLTHGPQPWAGNIWNPGAASGCLVHGQGVWACCLAVPRSLEISAQDRGGLW